MTRQTHLMQIKCFMEDLLFLTRNHNLKDFKPLYEKYPKVRIGIRRVLHIIEKRLHDE